MLSGKRIAVVLPAYNAARTLEKTVAEIPADIVDEILLVDDFSKDETIEVARRLGLRVFLHGQNFGYGRNQKTCYAEALRLNADIVVMLHPDYQYQPRLVMPMAALIASGVYDVVLASRILGGDARSGGMPLYKYVSNRFLTFVQNLLIGAKLSEYHSGYRAFSSDVLRSLPLLMNSDDFVFDNEMLSQVIFFRYRVGEISCPTSYFPEASSINFRRSVKYGFGVLWTSLRFFLQRWRVARFRIFNADAQGLSQYYRPLETKESVPD
ncbi:MAG TPA: glycosyltransferase family 2 protein [Terriglobia bacterium]|nr:glycosyltransferase family 2 protein [Terriglobia bacterium]